MMNSTYGHHHIVIMETWLILFFEVKNEEAYTFTKQDQVDSGSIMNPWSPNWPKLKKIENHSDHSDISILDPYKFYSETQMIQGIISDWQSAWRTKKSAALLIRQQIWKTQHRETGKSRVFVQLCEGKTKECSTTTIALISHSSK